jgi:hypothetical protein
LKRLVEFPDPMIETFKITNVSAYPDVTKLDCALDAALWVLWVFVDAIKYQNYLTAADISNVLASVYSVSFTEREITNAFNRAGKKIHITKKGDKPTYKIMKKGIEYLTSLQESKDVDVWHFDGKKPWSSPTLFKDLFSNSVSDIRIVDKFYSRESLYMIGRFAGQVKIRWLTAEKSRDEDEAKFTNELSRFKTEYKNVEIRKHAKAYEFHDRYIITDDSLVLIGHGLIDLGRKESFLIVLKNDVAKGIRESLATSFEEKWAKASNLR